MNKKTFLFIRLLIAILLGSLVSISITIGNYILPIIAILSIIILFHALKKKVKGVIADERDYQIGGKAARNAISIYCLTMAILATTMMAMSKTHPDFSLPGQIIAYSTCGLLILYSVLFKIYSKYGDYEK